MKSLAIQASGAVLWGMFVSLTPGEIHAFALPILLWREFSRAKKHPFLPGFLIRVAIIAGLIAGAWAMPLKSEDRRIEALSSTTVTLDELSNPARMNVLKQETLPMKVTLPSIRPTIREAMEAVNIQTNQQCIPSRCATYVTTLRGSYIICISVEPK